MIHYETDVMGRIRSVVLGNERYSAAREYKDNPFIYISIIGPIYATGPT